MAAKPEFNLATLLADECQIGQHENVPVSGLALDSRKVRPGDLFIAIAGHESHGMEHVAEALNRGAVAVAYESNVTVADLGVPAVRVQNLRNKVSALAARFYGSPSEHLSITGVTGTNGKTSVVYMLAQCLDQLEKPCGIMGTLGQGFLGDLSATGNTTPDAVSVQKALDVMRQKKAQEVAMEVSSHGLDQGRVAAVKFDVAVYTNLTRDHLDYHSDMEDYFAAKMSLFQQSGLKVAVVNLDDVHAKQLLAGLRDGVDVVAYGLRPDVVAAGQAYVCAEKVEVSASGLNIRVDSSWGAFTLRVDLIGDFQVYNLLAVASVLLHKGYSVEQVAEVLTQATPPIGRMEVFGGEGRPLVIVDYAHTADALNKALIAAKQHCAGELWCVFGCGGDRDVGKRSAMARCAEALADHIVVTDDNPRNEPSEQIVADIMAGFDMPNVVQVTYNRSAAIAESILSARPRDVLVVAGKGHERYQVVAGQRYPFSDQDEVRHALEGYKS